MPAQPPIKVEAKPSEMRREGLEVWIWRRSAKGASFCQVERIRPVVKSSPWRTSGNQAWTGARPSLRANARVIIVRGKGWDNS